MRLKRKIVLFTTGILAFLLLISSVVSIQNFRKHYTDALVTGSFGVAHSIESPLNELLALGLPLHSLSGMEQKLTEVVEKNDYIKLAYVVDATGKVVFSNQHDQNDLPRVEAADLNPQQISESTWLSHTHSDGQSYIDIYVPLFDGDQRNGKIRLAIPSSVIDDKVMLAIKQQLANVIITFTLIAILLNFFLHRQVIMPIKRLSKYAESIAKAVPYETVRFNRKDEIGLLSGSLVRMSATLKKQIEALKSGGQLLEEKVEQRTQQLAQTNNILESSNSSLKLALERERKLSEALKQSEERFRMLFEQNKAVMLIIDPRDGQLIAANGVAVEFYGYPLEKLLQLKITDINMLSSEEISHEMKRAHQEARNHFYFRHKLASGEVRDVEVHSGPISWDDSPVLYSIIHDVTDRKLAEAELQRIAHYDALTGLPNRLLKADRLRQAIARCHRSDTSVAVCYLDLDGFKPINDTYGHDVGDLILVETAIRLQASVREEDTVSRIGGDEFVLILSDLSGLEQCCLILDRVLEAIAQPIVINDQVLEVCASIGLTIYPEDDAADADILLRHADQAMYAAKANGKNQYHLFDPVEDKQVRAHKEKLQRLQQALADNEFVLHYQPKVNMLTCEVVGIEALIRWNHPVKGLQMPGDFLHYLADSELEIAIGNWVIRRALEQQVELREAGLALPVSVNISAYHLQHAGFTEEIGSMLEQQPLQREGDLEFEILETSSIEDMSNIFHTLISCRSMGVNFALDDFGTGYSSLAYFHRLPVDSLKIDQTFVQGMLEDPQDLTIVDSVVRLAGAFKHPVIAEGVESLEHAAALLRLGCFLGQGYGIARPMPLEELCGWKQRWEADQEWQELKSRFARNEDVDVQAAIASHQQWVERLISSLQQDGSDFTVQFDSRHCAFGRWFHGIGYLHYGHLPIYDEIKKYHELVHELGKELFYMSSHGFRLEAVKRIAEIEVMRDRFIELIERLQQDELPESKLQKKVFSG
ncbi:MAG: EAL domain-containing protein [Candidatus Thiodiazotropha sp.]